jgi:C-terminal processing protease CtpA/Prc
MQAIEPLSGGGALKLTIATFVTPRGRDLHGRGVPPDLPGGRRPLRTAIAAVGG